ncbi:MAG TPA: hypothetical protein VGN70_03275 [Gammaproteobacteria bacterium]|jgi:hypothetical protein
MFDSYSSSGARHITVLPSRSRFEVAVSRILDHHAAGDHGSALLHITVQSESGTGSISPRLLNLVGNALRAGMHDGEVVYLGDAEFAVFLRDTDDHQAALYARTMAGVIGTLKAQWQDEVISIDACIGGALSEHCCDGGALLHLAESASRTARCKHGCKVHLLHGDSLIEAQQDDVDSDSIAALAFA